ncbi:hypothetical protein HPG69_011754 [Diceros bicornis minor]|uniref:Uncharacterized protein n=1 Tax=Diceros bicornis minor TaxID=77932 RepID=A0A7J7EHM5_DICBM|nr:hypothetical protein HPG69_011754 [Diceros bicornis minor]
MEETGNSGSACGSHLSMDGLEELLNKLSNSIEEVIPTMQRDTRLSKESNGFTFIKFSHSPKACSHGRNGQCLSPSGAKSAAQAIENCDGRFRSSFPEPKIKNPNPSPGTVSKHLLVVLKIPFTEKQLFKSIIIVSGLNIMQLNIRTMEMELFHILMYYQPCTQNT